MVSFHLFLVYLSLSDRTQRRKTLSSSEAEWVALLDTVKEIIFMIQLLISMKMSIKSPVIVRANNIGATFMGSNIITMSCTKQVDVYIGM